MNQLSNKLTGLKKKLQTTKVMADKEIDSPKLSKVQSNPELCTLCPKKEMVSLHHFNADAKESFRDVMTKLMRQQMPRDPDESKEPSPELEP